MVDLGETQPMETCPCCHMVVNDPYQKELWEHGAWITYAVTECNNCGWWYRECWYSPSLLEGGTIQTHREVMFIPKKCGE